MLVLAIVIDLCSLEHEQEHEHDYDYDSEGGAARVFTLQPLRRTATFGVRDA